MRKCVTVADETAVTSAARTPSTTSRPGKPVGGRVGRRRWQREHQRGAGHGRGGPALRVGGDHVDLVAGAEQLGHRGVGQPDRQRDQVGAVAHQRGAEQRGVGDRLAAPERPGQLPAHGVAEVPGRHRAGREPDRRQVAGTQHGAGAEVVGGHGDGHQLGRRCRGGPEPGPHRDQGAQRGEQSSSAQHRAARRRGPRRAGGAGGSAWPRRYERVPTRLSRRRPACGEASGGGGLWRLRGRRGRAR